MIKKKFGTQLSIFFSWFNFSKICFIDDDSVEKFRKFLNQFNKKISKFLNRNIYFLLNLLNKYNFFFC